MAKLNESFLPDNNTLPSIIFNCPKCGQEINLDQLLEHNQKAFHNFIEQKVQEKIDILVDEKIKMVKSNKDLEMAKKTEEIKNLFTQEVNNLKLQLQESKAIIQKKDNENNFQIKNLLNQKEIEFLNKQKEIIDQFNQEKSELNKLIVEKNSQIKNIESNKDLTIAKETEKVKNLFAQEINNLKLQLQESKALLQKKETENALQLQNLAKQNQIEFFDEKEKIVLAFKNQIEELKIKNAENRILQSKTKGENWELEVENELRKAFQYVDKIQKITEGETKADYLQIVKNNTGLPIGKIVYEVKNAKWSDNWLPKFAIDVAKNKTKYGILVATSFNEKFHGDISFVKSDEYENIWIADPWSFIFVAQVIRKLIEIENSYLEKEKIFSSSSDNSKIIEDYNKKILALKNYIDYDLPDFIKSFQKQLSDINITKNSLYKNADRLEKVRAMLETKFEKLIKQKLEKIADQKIIENDELEY